MSGDHDGQFLKGQMCQGTMISFPKGRCVRDHDGQFPKGQMCQGTMMVSFPKGRCVRGP